MSDEVHLPDLIQAEFDRQTPSPETPAPASVSSELLSPTPELQTLVTAGEIRPPSVPAPVFASKTTSAPLYPAVPGYEILGELGRGGMGVVYKARQIKANRVVALKMILAGGHASATELARFRTEIEAVARLQHPSIVQVFEVGEQDGLPFFSLEFCDGGSLDRKLKGDPMLPVEAAKLVETLARAMHAAHRQKVIHRDLKPANILLAADGIPKITDFGLAKKLDDVGQTREGAVMGTPSYMAPEQARGQTSALGPAADIYALGALLYDLLTGRPPFKGANVMATLGQVMHEEPVPPGRLQPGVPRDLETICLKCFAAPPKGTRLLQRGHHFEDLAVSTPFHN